MSGYGFGIKGIKLYIFNEVSVTVTQKVNVVIQKRGYPVKNVLQWIMEHHIAGVLQFFCHSVSKTT